MSTIQRIGMSKPIAYKDEVYEDQKKLKINIIKIIALVAIAYLGCALLFYCFAGCSFTAALLFPHYNQLIGLPYCFTCGFLLGRVISNFFCWKTLSRLIKNLDNQKKEDALIIQSPGMDMSFSSQVKFSEKYNLKIYEISSVKVLKNLLSSFPKDSLKLIFISAHGSPEQVILADEEKPDSDDSLFYSKYEGEYWSNLVELDKYIMRNIKRKGSLSERVFYMFYKKISAFVNFAKKREKSWRESFQSLVKDGPIILHSCSTAKGEKNIAKKISSVSQRTVIASSEVLSQGTHSDPLKLDELDISHSKFLQPRIIRLWNNSCIFIPFTSKDTTVVYKNGKLA